MPVLFFLLSVLCLIAAFFGLIKPGLVVRWGQNRTRKQALIVYGGLFLVCFVVFAATVPKPNKQKAAGTETAAVHTAAIHTITAQPTAATETPTAKFFREDKTSAPAELKAPSLEEIKKEQQRAVTKFQLELAWLIRSTDNDLSDVKIVINAAGKGMLPASDMLKAARRGEVVCQRSNRKASKLPTPRGLPRQAEMACTEAKTTLENAFYHGEKAFKDLAKQRKGAGDEVRLYGNLKMLALAQVDKARPVVGLPTTQMLVASPEYKAWEAYQKEHSKVFKEAQRKFGGAPHLAFKPGTTIKLAKKVFAVPGLSHMRSASLPDPSVKFINQAVNLQSGQEMMIWGRLGDSDGNPKYYLVKFNDGQADRAAFVNSVQLMWYDTPEHIKAQDDAREAYVRPKYHELGQKYYGSQGLNQDTIERRAIDEEWMMIRRMYK